MMQYGDKLVASITNQSVAESQFSPNELRGPPEDLIADVVAVGVIDLLESVQIHHHDYKRRTVAFSAAPFLFKEAIHVSGVRQARQIIGKSRFLGPFESQGIVDGCSGVTGNSLQEPDFIRGVAPIFLRIQSERTDEQFIPHQGEGGCRLIDRCRRPENTGKVLRWSPGYQDSMMFCDPSGVAFANL